jgi:hypothetical protein
MSCKVLRVYREPKKQGEEVRKIHGQLYHRPTQIVTSYDQEALWANLDQTVAPLRQIEIHALSDPNQDNETGNDMDKEKSGGVGGGGDNQRPAMSKKQQKKLMKAAATATATGHQHQHQHLQHHVNTSSISATTTTAILENTTEKNGNGSGNDPNEKKKQKHDTNINGAGAGEGAMHSSNSADIAIDNKSINEFIGSEGATEALILLTVIQDYDLLASVPGLAGRILRRSIGSGSYFKATCIRMGLIASHWVCYRRLISQHTAFINSKQASCTLPSPAPS